MRINKVFSRLGIGALLATVVTVAANPAQAASFSKEVNINFDENVGVGSNPLNGGTKLDTLWEKDYGLRMDSSVKELWLYDSNCEGNTCTGGDKDLSTVGSKRVNRKYTNGIEDNVLIIQENKGAADDYANRKNPGTMTFDFTDEAGVSFDSIGLLDFDDPGDPIFSAIFADGTTTGDFFYNSAFFKETKGQDGKKKTKEDNIFQVKNNKKTKTYISSMKLESTNWDGTEYITGDNSLREYTFDFGDKKVSEFSITLPGSGAVTGLNYYRKNKKKFARKVPEPTSILGLVAISGLAASSLKRKRKSSNI